MRRVLVLSPHPDDESIGCGGTLRLHCSQGDQVQVVFLTSGEKGGHGRSPAETVAIREREARAASTILGLSHLEFWHESDGRLRSSGVLVDRISRKMEEFKPDLLYVTHSAEMHPDHRAAARATQGALRRAKSAPPDAFMYEVWTPLQTFDHIVDISLHVQAKRRAIRAYRSQCAEVAFSEAALGLNRYRGELHSWPGGDYAEVFKRLKT